MPEPLVDISKYDLSKDQYDREGIASLIPHREGMSLLGGIHAIDLPNSLGIGWADTHKDMFWVQGHFPGNPVVPGVFLVEAAAQLSSLTFKLLVPEVKDKLTVFGGLDHARFRGLVRPGERVIFTSKLISHNRRLCKSFNQARVGDRLVFDGVIIGINT